MTVKFSKTDQNSEGHVRYLGPFAVVALKILKDGFETFPLTVAAAVRSL